MTLSNITDFGWDVLRLGTWLMILTAIFVPLERIFALRRSTVWRLETGNDLAYYFINSIIPAAILAFPLATIAALAQKLLPIEIASAIRAFPLWVNIGLTLVLTEIGSYWGHRLSHEIPWLWRFHAVHHSAEHMDFLVNTRAHPVDIVVTRLFALTPIAMLGLGANKQSSAVIAISAVFLGTFASFFIHANVRWRFGLLEKVIATPAFHHWHHSKREHINRNYSATLPVIDMIFGTYYLPDEWPQEYGTDTHVDPALLKQLNTPFQPTKAIKGK